MNPNDFFISSYGVKMPPIIYGTAWKKDRTAALVEQAIGLGFRGIDTACQPKHYNEAGVGDGVATCRKLGIDRFLTSLKNLQTPYLDCLILHSPLANRLQLQEVWQAMEQVFHNGGTRQIGISNCYDPQQFELLYRNAHVKPAVIQNRFYAETQYDRIIRDFCRQQGIIYQSFWTLTANPKVLAHTTFQTLAAKYQRSTAQLFFRYLNQINIIPLTGTTSKTHMKEDLAIIDFELTAEECQAIEKLL